MRATHFENVLILDGLLLECVGKILERLGDDVALISQADFDSRRQRIIGRLSHVGMVVWGNDIVTPLRLADDLKRPIAEDFVHVHIDRSTRAALYGIDGELVNELAIDDLLGSLHDRISDLLFEPSGLHVRLRGSLFDLRQRLDQIDIEHPTRDTEVLDRAHRLHSVIRLVGYLKLTQKIMFLPHFETSQL